MHTMFMCIKLNSMQTLHETATRLAQFVPVTVPTEIKRTQDTLAECVGTVNVRVSSGIIS